jgi:hypothetical protein
MTTTDEPWIRVPHVHTGGPVRDPVPCGDLCLTCRQPRRSCAYGPGWCAPICATAFVQRGPVHVCIITTHAAARLIIRPSRAQTTYTGPSGQVYPPPPIRWPALVVDMCPWCGRPHIHTITTPGPRWQRRCLLTRRPYHLILRRPA